ncbi:LysR family transcriptional regulator [Prochlorothrix hollandica]|uniref:Transcriptional regulator n=1 Tax=Prochlorothrix hollandica PCC 9006 = CALU 1027 TaxID=317619 RepID=A0A0M2PW51_PROHO|nr:LysR family transcriptional regulator [Prochlorothrix hollandica]KKI99312.1 transcriptional regulator [Prochlorothrix hollandica PCC 9006 = CALU 1027]
MRLEQLQAFLAIAETHSFQGAAKYCQVNQSTISRQIQSLEASVGAELFHRNGAVSLTLAGQSLLPRAKRICQEWRTATQELSDLLNGHQTELCVAAISSVCCHYLPEAFEQFNQEYPEVQLRVTSLGSDRALKVLRDDLVDIAVVMQNRFLTASSPLVVTPLFQDTIHILMAANHPLSSLERVPWDALARYPHAVFKDGYGMRRIIEEQFSQQAQTLNVALELNTLDAFRGIVRRGQVVALLPQSALLEVQGDPSLTVRSTVAPRLTREVVCVTTEDRLRIPPIRRFCELLQQVVVAQEQLPFPQAV